MNIIDLLKNNSNYSKMSRKYLIQLLLLKNHCFQSVGYFQPQILFNRNRKSETKEEAVNRN